MNQLTANDSESNPQALKHLFGKALLKRMADAVADAYPAFDRKRFLALFKELEALEMKSRVQLLRDELRRQLPKDYKKALRILLTSAQGGTLEGFDLWPFTEFVQAYGLEDVKLSLDGLKKLTPRFTSEFAVRPFLKLHCDETLKFLLRCARDPDVHLRRWASEGTRPRLPWGERLHDFVRDPSPCLPILELLKFDSELYVRKSVSNHLNDIAKDHPEKVIQLLAEWKKDAGTEHANKIGWIIHRSLRTLIKAGHPGALKLIGVSVGARVALKGLKVNQKLFKLGERVEFSFHLQSLSKKPQKLVIDYIVHFVKANQSISPKVFKLKTVLLPGSGEILISKSHHLKKVTTRSHYSGMHWIEIQVNGRASGRVKWELLS
jgi:3-methyladenine DNA glycosylase AlkC